MVLESNTKLCNRKRLKAALFPQENRDKKKFIGQKSSWPDQFDAIRLSLFIWTVLRFKIGCPEIKNAYLQQDETERDRFVQALPEAWELRNTVEVNKFPYSIKEVRR